MRLSKIRLLAALVGVALVAAACSGGGGGGGGDDPTEGALQNGERLVSFNGAGGLKLAGTLGVPDKLNGSTPAVLIIPTLGTTVDRDGFQNETMPDLLYKDLAQSFRAAGMVTLRYDRRGIGASRLESGSKQPTYDEMVGDAAGAVKFLTQRREVGNNAIAVVGHDISGWTAMRLAATESRVKSLTLVSTPGRPLVDIYADGFKASHGQASADRFRATVDTLLSTGSLPSPETIAAEHQSVLGQGQGELLKGMFSATPLADASKVKIPTMVTVGSLSTTVTRIDADLLAGAIGPTAQVASFEGDGPNMQPPQPETKSITFNPADESTHVFGARPVVKVERDTAALGQVSNFLMTSLKAAKA